MGAINSKADSKIEWQRVDDAQAILGECPVWLPEEGSILWIDIENGTRHETNFASLRTESTVLAPRISLSLGKSSK